MPAELNHYATEYNLLQSVGVILNSAIPANALSQ